jgi:hypothetical protein
VSSVLSVAQQAAESPILAAMQRSRRALLRRDLEATTRLVSAYGVIWKELERELQALTDAVDAGRDTTYLRERVLALADQVLDEVKRYAVYADREAAVQVQSGIENGLKDALKIVGQAYNIVGPAGAAALRAVWNALPAEAVEAMLGMTGAESPLWYRMTDSLGEAVADGVREALLQGVALGWNPVKVQDAIRRRLGDGLTWSLTATRTAHLWAYREATRAGYLANPDIVKQWVWVAALDLRTCPGCWAMHGSRHPLIEPLNDHHNGRCAMLPVTASWAELGFKGIPDTNPQVPLGAEAFRLLGEKDQIAILGPSRWAAWKAGEFDFRDLAKTYKDDLYGEMVVAASLKGLLGKRAQQYYPRKAREKA